MHSLLKVHDFPSSFQNCILICQDKSNPNYFCIFRIAHAPRGPYLKLRGDLILISSDLEHTMSKILPIDQQLIPVSFKRRLAYSGAYLEEYVEKMKVLLYFQFLKENNHLYKVSF